MEKQVVMEICDADVDGVFLHLVCFFVGQINLFGEFESLAFGQEIVLDHFILIWDFEMNEVCSVGPQD